MGKIRHIASHAFLAVLEATLIASMVVVLVAGTTLAGKGGNAGGGSTGGGTVAMVLVTDVNGDGLANWGDSITYRVSTTATTKPYVSTACYQGTTLVLSGSAGFFAGYPWPAAQTFALKSDRWTGGAADCTAKLYYATTKSTVVLATITFHVNA